MVNRWIPYCGAAPVPEGLLATWNLDPLVLLGIGLFGAGLLYFSSLDRKAGGAALLLLLFLFVTPFCVFGSALFTVRVIHDLILAALLAPLLAITFRLPQHDFSGSIGFWTALHAVVFLAWHAPPLYEGAMSSGIWFWTMQATITGTAALWWAKLLRAPAPAAAAALLAMTVAMSLLGALLTFSKQALYAPHWLTTQAWGLSALGDQQLAGAVMWAPGGLVYLLAALGVLYRQFDGGKDASADAR